MEQQSEATVHGHEAPSNTKLIWRTLAILSVITIIELIVGMAWAPGAIKHNHSLKIWFNVFYLIMTLAKAYFIVSEFMHLGHEVKNLIMTIIFPLTLFIWFIIAFLWEGSSYKSLRDTYNPQQKVESKAKAEADAETTHEHTGKAAEGEATTHKAEH